MKQNPKGTTIIFCIVIVIGSMLTLFKVKSAMEPDQLVAQTRRFNVVVLNQAAASPGKVVLAVKDGKTIGSYTCTAQDAEVAWLYDAGATKSSIGEGSGLPWDFAPGPPVDENNRVFPIRCLQKGELIRLRIPRGYAQKPLRVSFPVFDGVVTASSIPKRKTIVLDQFAEPTRCIPPMTPSEIAAADKLVQINCYVVPGGEPYTHLTLAPEVKKRFEDHSESWREDLLSTAYCPEGDGEPEFSHYVDQLDAVKVRVNRYHYTQSVVNLTYKKAQIVTVDGVKELQFPTTQHVGMLEDAEATIEKSQALPKRRSKDSSTSGLILVKVQRHPHGIDSESEASFAGMTPSIESLGIDVLHIRLGGNSIGVDLKRKGNQSLSSPTIIPELTISVRIRKPHKFASDTMVLPIHLHHVKTKPKEFEVSGPAQDPHALTEALGLNLPTNPH